MTTIDTKARRADWSNGIWPETDLLYQLLDEIDRLRDRPWERLREMGFDVDETGVSRQRVLEREIVELRVALTEALIIADAFSSYIALDNPYANVRDRLARIAELRKRVTP